MIVFGIMVDTTGCWVWVYKEDHIMWYKKKGIKRGWPGQIQSRKMAGRLKFTKLRVRAP